MSLRDAFERLGVPDHLLAQVIWAEFDAGEVSPAQLADIARRVFPADICALIEERLHQAQEPRPRAAPPAGLAEGRDLLRRALRRA